MILYAFRPHTVETAPAWPGAPLRAWRWAVVVHWGSIEVEEQVRRGDGAWGPANRYVGVYLAARPRVGFHHLYHDGPHHSLWLGFVNVSWMRNKVCPTCEPGGAP